jgi:hypothetical protein
MPAMPVLLRNEAEACVANYSIDDGRLSVRHREPWPLFLVHPYPRRENALLSVYAPIVSACSLQSPLSSGPF